MKVVDDFRGRKLAGQDQRQIVVEGYLLGIVVRQQAALDISGLWTNQWLQNSIIYIYPKLCWQGEEHEGGVSMLIESVLCKVVARARVK